MALILHRIRGSEEIVQIQDGPNRYFDTVANFAIDNGSPFPALPSGDVGREYLPGKRHFTKDDDNITTPQSIPWTEGDDILTALTTIIAAKVIRETPPAPTLSEFKAVALRDIDRAAELARKRFLTLGVGQALVYQEKGEQAADFVAAGYPTDLTGYPFIRAEVLATSETKENVADGILAQRSAWIAIGADIEEIRLRGKKQVTDAPNEPSATAQRNVAVNALDAI